MCKFSPVKDCQIPARVDMKRHSIGIVTCRIKSLKDAAKIPDVVSTSIKIVSLQLAFCWEMKLNDTNRKEQHLYSILMPLKFCCSVSELSTIDQQ